MLKYLFYGLIVPVRKRGLAVFGGHSLGTSKHCKRDRHLSQGASPNKTGRSISTGYVNFYTIVEKDFIQSCNKLHTLILALNKNEFIYVRLKNNSVNNLDLNGMHFAPLTGGI